MAILTALDLRLNTHEALCRSRLDPIRVSAADRIFTNIYRQLMTAVSPSRGWEGPTLTVLQDGVRWANLGAMNGPDIEAMCFLILMQAAKFAQEDLRNIMDQMSDTNEKKAKMRALAEKMQLKATTSPYMPWPPTITMAN